ncbi:MAG: glycoside hydrolase family 127 protein [Phycisphaerales bacterium]|nr:glycoside hydrolase family 127 protein [Phycisphaerales bacterium]
MTLPGWFGPAVGAVVLVCGVAEARQAPRGITAPATGLRAVPLTSVVIRDGFWAQRQKVNHERTLWAVFDQCEKTGRIENLRAAGDAVAGKPRPGYKFQGFFFNDSDVHKAIEGAADILAAERAAGRDDPKLDAYLDDLIVIIARAQHPDGYLNSYFTIAEPEGRWTNLKDKHELYCGGHLIEAGVAHYRATGKRSLLEVAIRFADCVDATFGPGKRRGVCGHEEIELALIKLADVTGQARYLDLARFFVEERGRANGRELYGEYAQDYAPVREHEQVVGHAVRAMYLYCAVADLDRLAPDAGFTTAMGRVWEDLTFRKTYVTGGIGPSAHNEGFTIPYDLPNDTAYAETCAGIGSVMWNHRLALLHGDATYADAMERALYNGVLSGISLSGDRFFYVNPLATRGGVKRQEWFSCACCPPNILRLVGGIGGYAYAQAPGVVYINLYMDSAVKIDAGAGPAELEVRTRYPWGPTVEIDIKSAMDCAMHLRLPEWAPGATVEVDGARRADVEVRHGYLVLPRRAWTPGQRVKVAFDMPVQRLEANPEVKTNVGRVALRRGPVVYCVEGIDNDGVVGDLVVPREAEIEAEPRPDLLEGVVVLRGQGLRARPDDGWDGALYRPASTGKAVTFTAVPYYAWDNRTDGPMAVWLPESPAVLGPGPVPWISGVTSSHCWAGDSPRAMCDRREPESSADESIPRLTWWNHQGTTEWAQYEFDAPRTVSGVEVYWFDDTGRGLCRAPKAWRVMYREGGEWKPVEAAGPGGVEKDRYNAVKFKPVKTDGLRLEVDLQPQYSGGILEWKVVEERH